MGVEECWVSSLSFRDRVEDAREVVDFGISVLHLSWDEFGLENACICYHGCVDGNCQANKWKCVISEFPELQVAGDLLGSFSGLTTFTVVSLPI